MIIKVTTAWGPEAAQPGLAYWSLTVSQTLMLGSDSWDMIVMVIVVVTLIAARK